MVSVLVAALFLRQKPLVVCIDPGHPSEIGRGTRGRHLTELHLNWVVAALLKADLEKRHVQVVMTKSSEDQFVRNRARAETANRCHADLMVRLHCDSSNQSGFAVYYPDKQGSVDGFIGPSQALIQRIKPIAERFHESIAKDLQGFLRDDGLMSDRKTAVGSQHGALIGSVFSKVPVVLIEMCVLTNRQDETLVSTSEGQQRLADALADATLTALEKPSR